MILTDAMRVAKYAELETRMPEFEKQLHRDPQSFSPLPRERTVLQGEELAKSAEIRRTLAHFGTPAEAAFEHSQCHGVLAFMATEHVTGNSAGQFLVRDPMAHRRGGGISMRCFPISKWNGPGELWFAGGGIRCFLLCFRALRKHRAGHGGPRMFRSYTAEFDSNLGRCRELVVANESATARSGPRRMFSGLLLFIFALLTAPSRRRGLRLPTYRDRTRADFFSDEE